MVGVVDYGAGNLRSVETALRHLGSEFFVTSRPEEIGRADRLLVPGVGEARAVMEGLGERGLEPPLREFWQSGRPVLGICIGSQVIFEYSEERDTPCLGFLPGCVRRFSAAAGLKVPAEGSLVLAECDYGVRFAAAVGRGNLLAVQFHPEKSGPQGLRLLANFLAWAP
jgi:glutamine amidotransferase